MENYINAKAQIFAHQTAEDVLVLNYDNELSNQDFKRIFESYYKNAEIVAYDTNRNFDYKRECLPMYFKIKNEWILLFTQKGELRFSHIQNL